MSILKSDDFSKTDSSITREERPEILVIGSGIAGLTFALRASDFANIIIVTKSEIKESNTNYAQGGIAAVMSKQDNFESHIQDTLRVGEGLCHEKIVKMVVKNAPEQILWLENLGLNFDRKGKNFDLSKESAHEHKRIIHAGDITGEEIEKILIKKVLEKNVKIYEDNICIDLIVKNDKCYGAQILNLKSGKIQSFLVDFTVLTTGGTGRLYRRTSNAEVATGDGIAIAFRAGADITDMEFVQFHPTMLYNSNPSFLISETLRGEGGVLKNKYMKSYMHKYAKAGELAPRNVVSRATIDEMKRTDSDYVYLDLTNMDEKYIKKRFKKIYKKCLEFGVDFVKEPIPVTPTVHYICGGVKINSHGESNIKKLYAIGEVSCSGLHGGDRLASNSLIESLVFSKIVSEHIKNIPFEHHQQQINFKNNLQFTTEFTEEIRVLKSELQNIMWEYAGVHRTEKGLQLAEKKINNLEKKLMAITDCKKINKDILELKNMILVSKMIIKSALMRKESRASHYIEDYPKKNDELFQKHFILNKKDETI